MVSKIKLLGKSLNVHLPYWLILVLGLALLLRIPSFFEPYSYGDETIYLTLGEGIRQGKVLYRDIHDNKPPLLYFTAAVAGNLFWFKVILAFWSFVTIVLFWALVSHLFPNKIRLQQVATAIFAALTTLPLFEGNIANAENFMIGFSIAAFLILLTKNLTFKNIFFAGVLFGVATLFKIPAAFEAPTIVFFWLITNGFHDLKTIAKRTIYLIFGFSVPILIIFILYALLGAGEIYLVAAYLQNFGYLSAFRGVVQMSFLGKNAPLLLRALMTLLGILVLFPFRKKISKEFIFLTIWLFLALFAITLPERPYPHYLLQSTPMISMMLAILFTFPSIEQVLVILPLTVALLVPTTFKFWSYSTGDYYLRFLNFAVGKTSRQEYLSQFGSHVPSSYKIAEFILNTTSPKSKVFIWGGENQTIYALSRRLAPIKYIAQYHINDFSSQEEVIEKLNSNPPKLIVILPGSEEFSELKSLINKKYMLINNIDNALIYSESTRYLP